MNHTDISRFFVVIPAYNEAGTIRDITTRTLEFCENIIVVDDGSRDMTRASVQDLPVTVLHNPVNMGKGGCILRGAQQALEQGADSIITLDGDGQHRPEDIPLLMQSANMNSGTIIIAARLRGRHAAPALRRFANHFADFWISWAAGQRILDSQSGFRLYPASVFRECRSESAGFVLESEILINAARLGIHTLSVPIDTLYDENARPSHYRPARDTLSIVRMVAWKLICRGLYPSGLLRSLGVTRQAQNL